MNSNSSLPARGIHAGTLALAASAGGFVYMAYNVGSLWKLWYLTLLILVLSSLVLSKMVTSRYMGLFIDARNVMSLSRIQMFAWTVLVLSAFVASAFWNLNHGVPNPIGSISFDYNLLVLMGISTTSLVASPLILSLKETTATGTTTKDVFTRPEFHKATWEDLFTGEANGNADYFDLSRLQMFLFTVVVLVVYWVVLRNAFGQIEAPGGVSRVTSLPSLPEGVLWLVGISHGGYLTMKAVSQQSAGTPTPNGAQVPSSVQGSGDTNTPPAVGQTGTPASTPSTPGAGSTLVLAQAGKPSPYPPAVNS